MNLSYTSYDLQFRHPFGVSSLIRTHTTSLFVRIESEGRFGYGEACLPPYLGETVEGTSDFFEKGKFFLSSYDATMPLQFLLNEIDGLESECNAAKAALDMALHDLYGKLHNQTYREMMGIAPAEPAFTSVTIAIDNDNRLQQKIEEAADFAFLKIKAGTADDRSLIKRVRSHTDKPLFVDVNQGWKDKKYVIEMLEWMHDQNVLLVEQPMPRAMKDEMTWVTERSPLPTIADESVKRMEDLEKLNGEFSGINIKLMKCTGLREAMRMISYCKKNNMQIMLGCMAESSCGTSAMAQLMQFADFVDLDAPLLYKNDPFKGVFYNDGKIHLSNLPGIGVLPPSGLEF